MGKLIRVKGLKQLKAVVGIQTIGLDLGDRFSQFCAVGGDGEILQEGRVPTTVAGMQRFFGGMEPVTVAVGSSPSHSLGPLALFARLAAERPTVRHRKMKSAGILFELIQRLDEFEDNDRLHPLVIYAQNGADAGRNSPALVCPRSEGGSLTCPLDPSLSEVLSVEQARDAIAVWSAWRDGLAPSPEDRFRTVMFFSQHGAFFPLESDREGM